MTDALGEEDRFASSLEVEKNEDFFQQVGHILDEVNALPPAVYVTWQAGTHAAACASQRPVAYRRCWGILSLYCACMQDLSISVTAHVGSAAITTVGNVLIQFAQRIMQRITGRGAVKLQVLHPTRGVLRPGLTLLLGPPSCGKTSLLKALSGQRQGPDSKVQPRCHANRGGRQQQCSSDP